MKVDNIRIVRVNKGANTFSGAIEVSEVVKGPYATWSGLLLVGHLPMAGYYGEKLAVHIEWAALDKIMAAYKRPNWQDEYLNYTIKENEVEKKMEAYALKFRQEVRDNVRLRSQIEALKPKVGPFV